MTVAFTPSPHRFRAATALRASLLILGALTGLTAAPNAPAAETQASQAPPAAGVVAVPEDTPPIYATRPPPPAHLQYELRRGMLTARGELIWQPAGAHYEMRLEGRALGLSVIDWASSGGFDAAGLAPQRFIDQRTGRAAHSADFRRDKGVITYSGTSAEHPLPAGAQDRLSWMLQLAAIVEADPARHGAGQKVAMLVSGARGDADVWTFVITGHEAVDLVDRPLPHALHARRESRKPHDTVVDVWLDPARHHLPVRMRLASGRDGSALEFVLAP